MRLAFTLPSAQIHRPLNAGALFSDPRGLTGSEAALVGYATGLAKLGHEVTVYTNVTAPGDVDGARFRPYGEWSDTAKESRGAVIAWMSSTPLMPVTSGAFRVAMEQCSDFGNHVPGWERFVDSLLLLSRHHAAQMASQSSFPAERIRIAANGVDPHEFRPLAKVPGSCLWASSHDRGLHNLLELWPEIRRRVPWATLKVCYDPAGMHAFSKRNDPHPLIQELARRSTYCIEMLRRLEGHGVSLVGSVSRREIAKLMGESEVLLYPCQPARVTETFSSTILESMAAGCVPVITSADCLAELWCGVAPHVAHPFAENRSAYLELAVTMLTNSKELARVRSVCIGHAHRFTWETLVAKFERFLMTRGAEGLETP